MTAASARSRFRQTSLPRDKDVTPHGPGESYHNYGRAADVYFNTLRFIQPDGTIIPDSDSVLGWLESYDVDSWRMFWEARNNIAKNNGPFPGGDSDRPHLKGDSRNNVGLALVALLNRHKTMKWEAGGGTPKTYRCDLGFGKKTVQVGTALQIWEGNATLTQPKVAQALGARIGAIKKAHINELKKALRAEFAWAEKNRNAWMPK